MFASSPRFTVYAVAATTGPAPTQGGPDIVPTYTFADTTTGRAPRPDVVVVPAVNSPDSRQEAPLRTWVTDQANDGARILGVCYGSGVLAETGLLDGRTATSHWSRIGQLTKAHPHVNWVRGQRFVQDGAITTTAGVTSGIPGALRVMSDLAGPREAARVGRLVGYPNWSATGPTDIPIQSFTSGDVPIGLNAVLPWGRPTVGVTLTDGVGEIDLASSFEVFDVSYAARAVPLSVTGTITTKHGLRRAHEHPDGRPDAHPTRRPRRRRHHLDPAITAWAAPTARPHRRRPRAPLPGSTGPWSTSRPAPVTPPPCPPGR